MGRTEVETLAAALDAEPLFHLSLGSKELFHTNFLGWLVESHPGPAAAALSPWLVADAEVELRVKREWKKLDLYRHLVCCYSVLQELRSRCEPNHHAARTAQRLGRRPAVGRSR